MKLMDEILRMTEELKELMETPVTKFSRVLDYSDAKVCAVCENFVSSPYDRFCSEECAEIHSYDIAEAEATGN